MSPDQQELDAFKSKKKQRAAKFLGFAAFLALLAGGIAIGILEHKHIVRVGHSKNSSAPAGTAATTKGVASSTVSSPEDTSTTSTMDAQSCGALMAYSAINSTGPSAAGALADVAYGPSNVTLRTAIVAA